MSKYYRGSLPDGEDERLHTLTLKILELLQIGPVTNKYFAANVCLDYRKRINELRRDHGYHIKSRRIGGKGLFEYRLLDQPEPLWEVVIKTIAPDGQSLIYSIDVNAATATEARNNAPRKYVRNEILSVRRKDDTGAASPPPKNKLQVENDRLRELVLKLYKRMKELERKLGDARKNGQSGGQEAP